VLLVPRLGANGGQEAFHAHLVTAEQLAIEMTGIPIDQNSPQVEHDRVDGPPLRHARKLLSNREQNSTNRLRLREILRYGGLEPPPGAAEHSPALCRVGTAFE
jgi:hypothetical protein